MLKLWPFGSRRRKQQLAEAWSLSLPLMKFSRDDTWTIGNACEGTLVLGATGSGKSSGSGRQIALSFLQSGFGGIVLTAKAEERRLWENYAEVAGRLKDLICFGPGEPWRFNFLDSELRFRNSVLLTDNIVSYFMTVMEIAERGQGQGGGREDEGYWRKALKQLLRNAVDLLVFATGSVSVPDLYRIVISAAKSLEKAGSDEWKASSFCYQCLGKADKASKSASQKSDFGIVADYFLLEFPALSDKTRSVIVSTFTSCIDVLNRGVLRELFCTTTNLTPNATEEGKIILIDLPVKEFREVGQFAQVLWKYAFQRSIERRDVRVNPRPVFLWADEAQNFITPSYDFQFQTTCRSSRVAVVLLSQNISNFYAALGGNEKARVETDSLVGNLNTKILHANGDAVSNEWASRMIGRCRQFFMNSEQQPDNEMAYLLGFNQPGQNSAGLSEQYEFEVQPSVFTTLRTGGLQHRGLIDAIVFQNGKRFGASGRTWLQTTFKQQL
jgi:type IV secretory pathway TraG/TraD family ATPase VirD4